MTSGRKNTRHQESRKPATRKKEIRVTVKKWMLNKGGGRKKEKKKWFKNYGKKEKKRKGKQLWKEEKEGEERKTINKSEEKTGIR